MRRWTVNRAEGETRRAGRTLIDLGEALLEKGDDEEAASRLTEAWSLLSGEPDPNNQARVLIHLGRARAGNSALASDLLTRGLRIMREIGSATGEVLALRALAELALSDGRRDDARGYQDEARAVAARLTGGNRTTG
ncbi:hypothetical protein [Sphaerisporangium sp. TRM90804]|uniref:hypothetical protein n=1 Tax=Sphaerisporangium sp. TRM90804 TaxID=3031113 RepID=UPI00244D43FF|nr:hypothetical protein [Sphaerisporangium sp. TRM90804]MDH2424984.1 hypothetical protein [Sphaerisporangium sp. TRM90804]